MWYDVESVQNPKRDYMSNIKRINTINTITNQSSIIRTFKESDNEINDLESIKL